MHPSIFSKPIEVGEYSSINGYEISIAILISLLIFGIIYWIVTRKIK